MYVYVYVYAYVYVYIYTLNTHPIHACYASDVLDMIWML
jgi:hypothetical protein